MSRFGVATYVHGWYHEYVPLFVHAWQRAYPDYRILVFTHEERQHHCPGAEFIHLPSCHRSQKPYYMRWLIPPEKLVGLDYAFICDVDLLAIRESPAMHTACLYRMIQTGRPFANWVRPPADGYPNRVTGWHFIDVEKYYEKVWPFAERVLHDETFDIANPPSYRYDNGTGEKQWGQEALLYQLLDAAFHLDARDREVADTWANHHGLHLGPLRGGMKRADILPRLGHNAKFWNDRPQINTLLTDPEFQRLVSRVTEPLVQRVLRRLYELYELRSPAPIASTSCPQTA